MSTATYYGWGDQSGWVLEVVDSSYPFVEIPETATLAAMRVKTDDGYKTVYPETSAAQIKTASGLDVQTFLEAVKAELSKLGQEVSI